MGHTDPEKIKQAIMDGAADMSDEEVLELFEKPSDVPLQDFDDVNGSGEYQGRLKPGDRAPNGKYYHVGVYWITNRLLEGLSPIVIFCGKEGKGKSMKALEFARQLHEIGVCEGKLTPEKVEKNLVYSVEDFLYRLISAQRQVIIFDEAGKNLNSKDWQTSFNRAVDKAIQTQRIKENVYIFVLPKADDLDRSIRERPDGLFEAQYQGIAKFTGYEYDYNNLGQKVTESRNPVYFNKKWRPDMPSDDLVEAYRLKEGRDKQQYIFKALKKIFNEKKEDEKNSSSSLSDLADSLSE